MLKIFFISGTGLNAMAVFLIKEEDEAAEEDDEDEADEA